MRVRQLFAELTQVGFSLIENVHINEVLQIASDIGEIRVDSRSPELIRDIRPQQIDEAKPNTLSSRYGMDDFPFHTDVAHWHVPAKYLVLYCEQVGCGDRPTLLQDTQTWEPDQNMWSSLSREVWKSGHLNPHLCTVAQKRGDKIEIRYDEACMSPMTPKAMQAKEWINKCIQESPVIKVQWRPKTLLILDNCRMVHARGRSKRNDADRIIKRILIGEAKI